MSRDNVYRWRARYWERRDPADLLEQPKAGRRRRLDEAERRYLEDLLQKKPAALGYCAHGWTVPLLLAHLHTERGVEVSESTLRRTLRALGYRWKRPRYVPLAEGSRARGKKSGPAGEDPRIAEEHGGALL